METPQIAHTFLESLGKSGLLPPEQIASTVDQYQLENQPAAKDVAQVLVKKGLLTCFQVERLLEGRYRGFFIDQYKVLEILGAGGMGWVYTAEDVPTGRKVAVKVLSERHKSDAGMMTRLKIEAQAGLMLEHPNIVRTLKIDHAGDLYGEAAYVVMEYMEGVSLHELLQLHGPIPWPQACDIILQAADGLQHAHEAGIVHRDVKPANFLIDHTGHVKILDFGLSLLEELDEEFSLAMIFGHECLGTADFMAPEQSFDSLTVDHRADLYSLGCTMHFALTGRVPFPGKSNAEILQAHCTQKPRDLRELAADVPQQVVDVVDKMMAKEPANRFQSADEVCEALKPFSNRKLVSFNFQKLLAFRAKDARERMAAMRRQRKKRGLSPSSTTCGPEVASSVKSQADVDTTVHKQTQTSGTSISLVDPFHGFYEPRGPSGRSEETLPALVLGRLLPLDGGSVIPLKQEQIVIGRHPESDVQLPSSHVSSKHCELRFENSRWRVVDLKSKNGMRVNGVDVTDRLLRSGDRITIADRHRFEIRFETKRVSLWKYVALIAGACIALLLAVWGLLI